MLVAITVNKPEQTGTIGYQGHKQSSQPGRDIIQYIVQTGCHTTELPVTLIFITDHRIQGVYHLISHHSRKSAQSIIK